MAWRYLAQRLLGNGQGEFLGELPLSDAAVTDVLSGPLGLEGSLPADWARALGDDGKPLLHEWSTAIYAEADGEIRGGGILVGVSKLEGPRIGLDCVGFTGFLKDQAWTGTEYYGIQVDPLDVFRTIWAHAQGQPDGNLGMRIANTTSPVRIGTALELVEFQTGLGETVRFEAGPVKFTEWTTDDLAREVDTLAKETPFDYHERHAWEGEQVAHHIDLGYPRLGRRRDDLRFVLGENLRKLPSASRDGEEYANVVIALGSGEGRDMKRATVSRRDGRICRVKQVQDKSLRSIAQCTELAQRELVWAQGLTDVTEVVVLDHPHAPIGSWAVGDEINVQAELSGGDIDLWFRVVSSTINPDKGDAAVLTIARSDKVAA